MSSKAALILAVCLLLMTACGGRSANGPTPGRSVTGVSAAGHNEAIGKEAISVAAAGPHTPPVANIAGEQRETRSRHSPQDAMPAVAIDRTGQRDVSTIDIPSADALPQVPQSGENMPQITLPEQVSAEMPGIKIPEQPGGDVRTENVETIGSYLGERRTI